ncbi:MAG TPA: Ig-like domain-containing protein, partial [Flavisolibacter sp.]
MQKNFTRLLLTIFFFTIFAQILRAQTTITQWNFNSNPPDANTATGSSSAYTGMGTLINIGGVTNTFNSGSANGGSSDPAPAADNSGYQTTNYAAQGTGDKTTGIQVAVSTAGFTGVVVSYDLRHSNTSSRYELLQYTTDITAVTPVWVDAQLFDGNAGDTWFKNRTVDLSSITALNNNPNAGFRIVATFVPSTSAYAASATTYAAGGTWRFDMVTVKGTSTGSGDVTAPVAQTLQATSSTTSFIKFSEPVKSATATNVANYVFTPSRTINTAALSASGDTVFLNHTAIVDGQPYTVTVSGVQDGAGNTMASIQFNIVFNTSTPNLVITEIIHSPNDIE